jgi:hypothetical protein
MLKQKRDSMFTKAKATRYGPDRNLRFLLGYASRVVAGRFSLKAIRCIAALAAP